MIKASKKQNRNKHKKDIYGFHKSISRRKHLEQKLFLSSIVAAAVAFLLWLFAVSLPYRVAIVIAAFVAASALRVKSSVEWAFIWIAKSIGLSYETAIEYRQKDKYGFFESLNQRVKTLSIKLEKPKHNNWWLPILALAVGFSLLPFSPFSGSHLWAGFNNNHNKQLSQELGNAETKKTQPIREKNLENNPDIDSLNSDAPDTPEDAMQNQDESLSDGYSEDEALADYLDKISESKKPNSISNPNKDAEQKKNPFSSIEKPQDSAQKPGEGGQNNQQAGEQQSNADAQQSENSHQNSSASTESLEKATSDEKKSGQSSSSSSEEKNQAENQNSNNENKEQSGENKDAQNQDNPSQGEQKNSEQEEGQGVPKQSNNPNDPQQDQELGSGEKGKDGVDNKASAEVEGNSQISTVEAKQSEQEFLEGPLGRGQSNQAGTVRMAGARANRGDPTTNNSNFKRSQEEAISEGNIPLEYQEIIRKYFE